MQLDWRPVAIDGGEPVSTSLTADETKTLRELARGRRVLEIGSAFGYSTIAMATVGARVLSVDPHIAHSSILTMTSNLRRYRVLDRVAMCLAYSYDALPILEDAGARFDLIFIDGDHSRSAVERDVWGSLSVLAPGGTLACHDYEEDTCPGVARALDASGLRPSRVVDTLWIK